jgi:ferredoxin/flavodoxin
MNIDKTVACYLSGTGTTEKYLKAIAAKLPGQVEIHALDARNELALAMGHDDLLTLAAPVYGGHIAPFVWKQLEAVTGDETPALIIATYGARDYDNALLEMQSKLVAKGFRIIGAAALVARHSIVQSIAADRPNADDIASVEGFAQDIATRLLEMNGIADAPAFKFKGELGNVEPAGMVPIVTDECIECGLCARECPALAIPEDAPNTTDANACISCLHCIDVCPVDARKVPDPLYEKLAGMLAQKTDPSKTNEFF